MVSMKLVLISILVIVQMGIVIAQEIPEESLLTEELYDNNIVSIPSGAHISNLGINFFPGQITSEASQPIIWKNNDKTIHTVISAKIGINNNRVADGLFDSGTFGPDSTFELILEEEGEYLYFCRLHPWLTGTIIIKPYTGTKELPVSEVKPSFPVPEEKPSFPVPDEVLIAIWEIRPFLQNIYPEVGDGNLKNLKKWAFETGWNDHEELAVLIPEGKTPKNYVEKSLEKPLIIKTQDLESQIPTFQIVVAVISIGIGGYFGYKYYSH